MVRIILGGDDGVRTHDPLLAGQVLSQLSYTPIFWGSLLFRMNIQTFPTVTLVLHPSDLSQVWPSLAADPVGMVTQN